MRILALDDEYLALEGLSAAIRAAVPDAELHSFRMVDEALRDAEHFQSDVAFLDIELRGESGISVARKLKALCPRVNIIFVTGFADYMKEAFDLHASGYVMKPVEPSDIKEELANLRFIPAPSESAASEIESKKRLFVRTFGSFAVFLDGKPLKFDYTRTSELFAALIDANGEFCTVQKLVSLLWEDEDTSQKRSYLRMLLTDLRHTLLGAGLGNVILHSRGLLAVDRSKISCDYFDFRDKKDGALDAFNDEYMSQYSWAEPTLGAMISGLL